MFSRLFKVSIATVFIGVTVAAISLSTSVFLPEVKYAAVPAAIVATFGLLAAFLDLVMSVFKA